MNRMDLEDAIMKAWQTSDDLELFFRHHGDHPKPMTEDEVSNMLLGLKNLHDMRMNALFEVFKRVHQLDEYCTDEEALLAREQLMGFMDEEIKPKKKGKKKC